MKDLERLQTLIGKEFDTDDIICEMIDEDEQVIVSKIEGYTSNFEEHGECQLYNVYYDYEDAIIYEVWVDYNNIIIYVC